MEDIHKLVSTILSVLILECGVAMLISLVAYFVTNPETISSLLDSFKSN